MRPSTLALRLSLLALPTFAQERVADPLPGELTRAWSRPLSTCTRCSHRSTREDCERIVRECGGEQAPARLAR